MRRGEFFILNGVMIYVAEVGETHIRNGKKNAAVSGIDELRRNPQAITRAATLGWLWLIASIFGQVFF